MSQTLNPEQLEAFRLKYRKSGRARKTKLLDEFVSVTGCHRKHVIRLLKKKSRGRPAPNRKRGPRKKYSGEEFIRALRLVWRATDYMCSKLLRAAIPDWLPWIEKHHGEFSEEVRELLLRVSPATIDRVLKPYKHKPKVGTKPGTLLKTQIPIQGSVWNIEQPGFVEADTVAHCGNSLQGLFAWSLTLTDICTQWTECRAVWHKAASGVVTQIKDIEKALPFELLGFDCDNGSEFLNKYLLAYFSEKKKIRVDFTWTRSRPNHKNDNAHVEQKNWTHPRRLYGRDRLDLHELIPLMNDLYASEFSLLRNHFFPNLKLSDKVLLNSRFRRRYETPLTPYQRVLNSSFVSDDKKHELVDLHQTLDPIDLGQRVRAKLRRIYNLYKRLRSRTPDNLVA